jgi:Lar family restriction alleviation protein
MEQIKPCPYCSGEGHAHGDGDTKTSYVMCDLCGSCGPVVQGISKEAREKAIKLWNERAQ